MQNSPGSEKYVVAGLSGLGALLSAFLANTFYQAHRDANKQLTAITLNLSGRGASLQLSVWRGFSTNLLMRIG